MYRNAEYIYDNRIIDIDEYSKKAQVGVDLTLNKVFRLHDYGIVRHDGHPAGAKTSLPIYEELFPTEDKDGLYFWLSMGAYPVEFDQGLSKLSDTEVAYIIQRSSLNRCGCRLEGSIFDPGFETPVLGATLYVFNPIKIYHRARVAQLVIENCEPVSNLYDGQFQLKSGN